MRTTTVKIGENEHLLCFSVRVSKACSERYGSISAIFDVLNSKSEAEVVDETVWLFCTMMDGGYRYAQRNGMPCAEPLTEDDIMDTFDMPGFKLLIAKVKEAIAAGNSTNIETESSGNAEATRA